MSLQVSLIGSTGYSSKAMPLNRRVIVWESNPPRPSRTSPDRLATVQNPALEATYAGRSHGSIGELDSLLSHTLKRLGLGLSRVSQKLRVENGSHHFPFTDFVTPRHYPHPQSHQVWHDVTREWATDGLSDPQYEPQECQDSCLSRRA